MTGLGALLGAGLLAGCVVPPPGGDGDWGQPPIYDVSNGEMRRVCEDEGARRYRVGTRNVEVSNVYETGRGYGVDGRVLRSGRTEAAFECRFDSRGRFQGMRETDGGYTEPQVSEREMVRYCEDEAASRYRASRRDVDMERLRRSGSGYAVTGRVPAGRDQTAVFECRFGPRGGFDGMREIERVSAGPLPDRPGSGGGLSRDEMVRYCEGEAASRYRASRRDISMGRLEQGSNGFRVTGRVPVERGQTAVFECRFGARGGFQSMREVRRG